MNETIPDHTDQIDEKPEILNFTQASLRMGAHILTDCHIRESRPIIFSHQIENFLKHQKEFMDLTVNNEKILLKKIEQQVKMN